MKTKHLWLSWLYLSVLCAVLGFFPEPYGLFKALFFLAAIGFFIPPALLLIKGNRKTAKIILLLSALSLVLTTVLIILNFASALMAPIWGTVFYILMGIFTVPMLCSQFWILSLSGWACLLAAGMFKLLDRR